MTQFDFTREIDLIWIEAKQLFELKNVQLGHNPYYCHKVIFGQCTLANFWFLTKSKKGKNILKKSCSFICPGNKRNNRLYLSFKEISNISKFRFYYFKIKKSSIIISKFSSSIGICRNTHLSFTGFLASQPSFSFV
jgi:hypothetical protein